MRSLMLVMLLVTLSACTAAQTPATILTAFETANLPVTNSTSDGVLRPEVQNAVPSCQGVWFSAVGEDGIRVIVCGAENDATKIKRYYDVLGESSLLFFSHTFQRGNVVLQGNGELDKALFDSYVAALPK